MEFEKIKEVIAEQMSIDTDKITMDTVFTELGADSLDLFQIISELEEIFDMEFDVTETDKIKTVGDAVEFIKNK